jgi:Holliday junction resolvase-like predicted endonuclease
VEVKYRAGLGYGFPSEAVGGAKQRKIINTAMHYIAANNLANKNFRFDVAEVLEQYGKITDNKPVPELKILFCG